MGGWLNNAYLRNLELQRACYPYGRRQTEPGRTPRFAQTMYEDGRSWHPQMSISMFAPPTSLHRKIQPSPVVRSVVAPSPVVTHRPSSRLGLSTSTWGKRTEVEDATVDQRSTGVQQVEVEDAPGNLEEIKWMLEANRPEAAARKLRGHAPRLHPQDYGL